MTRPVFLNLFQIKFPVTAIVSILHRVSGVVLFLAIPVIYSLLYMSICSEASYANLAAFSGMWYAKLVYLLIIVAVLFHALAGIRHMHYDFSTNHNLAGAKKTAWAVILLTIVLAAMVACRIFFQV
jgi:succinate dehydrogenase / fumarate reductase, cytochrome b subunit